MRDAVGADAGSAESADRDQGQGQGHAGRLGGGRQVSSADGRVEAGKARTRDRRGQRLQRDLDRAWGCAKRAGGSSRSSTIRCARKELADNIKRAGFSDIVQVVAGDAFQQIPKVPGTFDFVFLDAWKKDYKRFFDMVFPRLDKRGLFLAHNVVNKRSEMGDFLDAIQKQPSVWTTIVVAVWRGDVGDVETQ